MDVTRKRRVLILVFVLAVIALGVFYWLDNKQQPEEMTVSEVLREEPEISFEEPIPESEPETVSNLESAEKVVVAEAVPEPQPANYVPGGKIPITREMVMNTVAGGNTALLVDGNTNTHWEMTNPWLKDYYKAVIDLNVPYKVDKIRFYQKDMWNNPGTITVRSCRKKTADEAKESSKENPLKCTDLFTQNLEGRAHWVEKTVNTTNQYFEIHFTNLGKAWVGEVELYGTRQGTLPAVTRAALTYPLMHDFIGYNAFNDNPVADLIPLGGHERDYVNISWFTGGDVNPVDAQGFLKNDSVTFEPGVGGFRFDRFYGALKNAGVSPFPVIKECFRGGFNAARESVCVPGYNNEGAGEDPYNPYSYRAMADLFYQVAARYGSQKVPDQFLKLRADQPRVSGLGYLKEIEVRNEPDMTWRSFQGWASPMMDAAMISAAYDGHLGSIGSRTGIKNADGAMKVSMGGIFSVQTAHGLPDLAISRLKLFKLWWEVYRNGKPFMDIINVHHYVRSPSGEGQHGISPEDGKVKEFAKNLVDFSRREMGGMPVWVTEFGYDTHPASNQGARAYGPYSIEEVQGMWLVRTFLELSAAGVQRASMYMFPDAGSQQQNYSTGGLVGTKDAGWPKKTSYYYQATLHNVLKDTRFVREVSTGSQVRNYEYKSASGKTVNVLWMPTSSDQRVTYDAGGTGTLIQFEKGSITGKSSNFSGGTIEVTEKPIFIVR